MVLRRIDPMSYAKIAGAIAAMLGLVIGVLYAFFLFAFSSLLGGESIGVALGLGMIILFPLLYGVLAFLIGLLSAWLYNVVAERVGGIEMEFDQV
jgi:hypothetical protein